MPLNSSALRAHNEGPISTVYTMIVACIRPPLTLTCSVFVLIHNHRVFSTIYIISHSVYVTGKVYMLSLSLALGSLNANCTKCHFPRLALANLLVWAPVSPVRSQARVSPAFLDQARVHRTWRGLAAEWLASLVVHCPTQQARNIGSPCQIFTQNT